LLFLLRHNKIKIRPTSKQKLVDLGDLLVGLVRVDVSTTQMAAFIAMHDVCCESYKAPVCQMLLWCECDAHGIKQWAEFVDIMYMMVDAAGTWRGVRRWRHEAAVLLDVSWKSGDVVDSTVPRSLQ